MPGIRRHFGNAAAVAACAMLAATGVALTGPPPSAERALRDEVQRSPSRAPRVDARRFSTRSASGATYFVGTDNEDNALSGNPDGDMGGATPPFLFDTDPLHPIEFNIDLTGPLPTSSAELLIEAWDVDETSGQIDHVFLNGNFLGALTGADGVFSTTVFSVPIGQVLSGINRVQIVVDEITPGTNGNWGVEIASGQLLIDGGGASDASCRSISFGASSYQLGGAPAGVSVEVDTVLGSQGVRVELNLIDPNDIILSAASASGTISAALDDPFALSLPLVESGAAGTYAVEALIFDQGTGVLQDRCEVPAPVRAGCQGFDELDQPMGLLFSSHTSDDQTVWEALDDVVDGMGAIAPLSSGPIRRLRWWGQSLEWNAASSFFVGECPEDDAAQTPFDLYFYDDASGAPGTLLDSRIGVVPSENVGTGVLGFGDEIHRYTATLSSPVDAAGVRWIGIRRQTGAQAASGNDCYFLWASEGDASRSDNLFFQRDVNNPTVNQTSSSVDLMLCVDGASIFTDGFEAGNTSAWSSTSPP